MRSLRARGGAAGSFGELFAKSTCADAATPQTTHRPQRRDRSEAAQRERHTSRCEAKLQSSTPAVKRAQTHPRAAPPRRSRAQSTFRPRPPPSARSPLGAGARDSARGARRALRALESHPRAKPTARCREDMAGRAKELEASLLAEAASYVERYGWPRERLGGWRAAAARRRRRNPDARRNPEAVAAAARRRCGATDSNPGRKPAAAARAPRGLDRAD